MCSNHPLITTAMSLKMEANSEACIRKQLSTIRMTVRMSIAREKTLFKWFAFPQPIITEYHTKYDFDIYFYISLHYFSYYYIIFMKNSLRTKGCMMRARIDRMSAFAKP
jgi:hypothetical protein